MTLEFLRLQKFKCEQTSVNKLSQTANIQLIQSIFLNPDVQNYFALTYFQSSACGEKNQFESHVKKRLKKQN